MRDTQNHPSSAGAHESAGVGAGVGTRGSAFHRWMLALVWIAFLVRGAFYCVQQPMWEGYDEWAHFAYIQHVAEEGTLPQRNEPVSQEVRQSLQLVPLSKAAAADIGGGITHDSFWRLNGDDRVERERALRALSTGPATIAEVNVNALQYEAQQPPLYYLLLAPVYRAARSASLPARVLLLRILSVLIASAVVWLGFAVARQVFGNPRLPLLAAALIASLPGLFIDVARVGNESLAIVLTSAVLLCAMRAATAPARWGPWLWLGVTMAAAALTKAYALALIPLAALACFAGATRRPAEWKRAVAGCCVAWGLTLSIAGWWYVDNWRRTGTVSGEQLDAAASKVPASDKIAAASSINWLQVADAAVFTHTWAGGWSFLVVRSWMYRVVAAIAGFAALGCVISLIRLFLRAGPTRRMLGLADPVCLVVLAYVQMCLVLAYHSLVTFITTTQTVALGWYLYAAVAAEATLVVLGISVLMGKRRAAAGAAAVTALAVVLDVYTTHFVLMPYYTGMVGRRASGTLESFHVDRLAGSFGEMLRRLSINEPAAVNEGAVTALWLLSIGATLGLAVLAAFVAWRTDEGTPDAGRRDDGGALPATAEPASPSSLL